MARRSTVVAVLVAVSLAAGCTTTAKPATTSLAGAGTRAGSAPGAPKRAHGPRTARPSAATASPTTAPAVSSARTPARTVRRTRFRPAGRVSRPPVVRARAWAVADLDTGEVLAVHRPHAHLPQASTIKLLTAVTAAATVPPGRDHRVGRAEAHPAYCTCVGLKVGRRYSRASLLAGALLPSGNDAALALAGAAGHGQAWFVAAMNAEARRLGATDTHVVTPDGLTAPGAYSSAHDLLVLLRAAQADPAVEPVLELSSFRFGPAGGRTRVVTRRTDYVNRYAEVDPGTQGKSGYTTPARNTLVVSTPLLGHRIGVAVLGSPGGHTTPETRALTLWAAANHARLRAVGRLPAAGPPLGQAAGTR